MATDPITAQCAICGTPLAIANRHGSVLYVKYCEECTSTENVKRLRQQLEAHAEYIEELEAKLNEYGHTWTIPELSQRQQCTGTGLEKWIGDQPARERGS